MKFGIVIWKSKALVIDLDRKKRPRQIGRKGVTEVASDGTIVAVTYEDRAIDCYRAVDGRHMRKVGKKGAISLCLTDGRLIIGYEDGGPDIIDLRK